MLHKTKLNPPPPHPSPGLKTSPGQTGVAAFPSFAGKETGRVEGT